MPTYKKNTTATYSSDTQSSAVFSISVGRLVAIVVGAIITSAVGTAFALSRTSISDHFLLVSVSADVDNLKTHSVSRIEFTEVIKRIEQKQDLTIDLLRSNQGTLSQKNN